MYHVNKHVTFRCVSTVFIYFSSVNKVGAFDLRGNFEKWRCNNCHLLPEFCTDFTLNSSNLSHFDIQFHRVLLRQITPDRLSYWEYGCWYEAFVKYKFIFKMYLTIARKKPILFSTKLTWRNVSFQFQAMCIIYDDLGYTVFLKLFITY